MLPLARQFASRLRYAPTQLTSINSVATRNYRPPAGAISKKMPKSDPAAPKRPQSAYLFYVASLRASGEKIDLKEAGASWAELGAGAKSEFMAEAATAKATYEKALADYKASGRYDLWKSDPQKPKKPLGAYMRFAAEFRAKQPAGRKITEIMKQAGENWRMLDQAQKDA